MTVRRPAASGTRPTPSFVVPGGELRLSNAGQLELLRGAVERGVSLRTPVRGCSMTPFIRDGDVVTFAPQRGEPRVGEVAAVALGEQGRMVVHRVTERVAGGWTVRGDACPEADGVFGREAFVGHVVRVERHGRRVRLGRAWQGRWIAAASRRGWLGRVRGAWRVPRRAAGGTLHAAQSLRWYRGVGRRLGAERLSVDAATAEDVAAVLERLGAQVAGERACDAADGVSRYAVRRGERTVGFAELVDLRDSAGPWRGCWLFTLEVWPLYRGTGIGSRLARTVIDEARARGAEELKLAVRDDNRRAVRLYLKLGFTGTVMPDLEPLLEKEAARTGHRRRVMRLNLGADRGRDGTVGAGGAV